MHVNQTDLLLFLEGLLPADRHATVRQHVERCEFCSELLDDLRLVHGAVDDETASVDLPSIQALSDRLYSEALRGRTIPLSPLTPEPILSSISLLAADGIKERPLDVENLYEYYSENPEMILRLMYSRPDNRHWVQLVADDPALVSNVLLRLPELGAELLTTDSGRADLPDSALNQFDTLKWEVKLPDLTFTLDPLAYDPAHTEYSTPIELRTDHDDLMRLTFEGKTEGKLLTVEFLELAGIGVHDRLHVYIQGGTALKLHTLDQSRALSISLQPEMRKLTIRLFKA